MTTRLAGLLLLLLAFARLDTGAADGPGDGYEAVFTARSANVAQSGDTVTIRLRRWSTDAERAPIVAALAQTPAPAAPADAARGARAGGGRGRGRAGRGSAVPLSPPAALAAALNRAPSIGYLWTSEVTGYSIKYSYLAPRPEGGERIVLATDRRLGAHSAAWLLSAPSPADYDFTVIELRLDAKGLGEGKVSLTTMVVAEAQTGTIALSGYDAAPALLQGVARVRVPQAAAGKNP